MESKIDPPFFWGNASPTFRRFSKFWSQSQTNLSKGLVFQNRGEGIGPYARSAPRNRAKDADGHHGRQTRF